MKIDWRTCAWIPKEPTACTFIIGTDAERALPGWWAGLLGIGKL